MSDSDTSTSGELSQEFEERFSELKLQWKNALKKTKKLLLKCPNYERCQFKCGSVGGMQYHYLRCTGKSPLFKCSQCSRQYESRTGLNYHMASNHGADPVDDIKMDAPSRPQRTAALSTMSAILIANNPPPLKQAIHKTPPKATPTSNKSAKTSTPQQKQKPEPKVEITKIETNLEPKFESSAEIDVEPKLDTKVEVPGAKSGTSMAQRPAKPSKKSTHTSPGTKAGKPDHGGGIEEEEEMEGVVGGVVGKEEGGGGDRGKKGGKYVNIPSIEYPDEYKSFLPNWRQEMKDNKIIKCPNYGECEFKCTTVNGMKYHYVRCMKANPPEFNCEVCGKKFQCRTGLVWHLKKTHMLVDMQPSKEGGFQGTIVPDGEAGADGFPFLSSGGGRKKVKLDETWRRRSQGSGRKVSTSSSKKEWYNGRSRRRLRKCIYPRRTADEILQNIMNITFLPEPKLGPQLCPSSIFTSEYVIADNIPTDIDPAASAIITLGEEALQWQRMYSDSSSEEDFMPDDSDVGAMGGRGVVLTDEGQFDGYISYSSASDSDEEYTVPYHRKRGANKPAAGRGTDRGSGEGGRGRGRRGRSSAAVKSGVLPKSVTSHVENMAAEVVEYGSFPSSIQTTPPPLLPKSEDPQLQVKGEVPRLIKASRDLDSLSGGGGGDNMETEGSMGSVTTHIQPPPGLIMPRGAATTTRSPPQPQPPKRQPPPLVKNKEETTTQEVSTLKTIPLQSSTKVYHPQIVLPSSDGGNTNSTSSYAITTKTQAPAVLTPVPSYVAVSAASPVTSDPPPPVKRRPGRPRKDQSLTVNAQTKKTAHTVHIGSNKTAQRTPSSARGAKNTGSSAMKGIKLTQYEFQSQSQSPSTNQGILLTQQGQQGSTPQQQQQYQPLILSSGSSTIPANFVTPLQILPTAQAGTSPLAYSTMPQGGVIYLQGATTQQEQPTYINKDGQLYQVIQPRSVEELNDNTKKVSVIVPPQVGGATAYVQGNEVGGFHYVAQLDGFSPCIHQSDSEGKEELREKFKKVRQRVVAIEQLDGLVPTASRGRGGAGGGGGQQGSDESGDEEKVKGQDRTDTSGVGSCDRGVSSSPMSSVEVKMSEKLEAYFHKEKMEQAETQSSTDTRSNGRRTRISKRTKMIEKGNPQSHTSEVLPFGVKTHLPGHVTSSTGLANNSNNNSNGGDNSKEAKKMGVAHHNMELGKRLPLEKGQGTRSKGKQRMRKGKEKEISSPSPPKKICSEQLPNLTPSPPVRKGCGQKKQSSNSATPKDTTSSSSQVSISMETRGPAPSGHTKRKNRGGGGFPCTLCNMMYTTKGGLSSHMATKHHPALPEDASFEECCDEWRRLFKKQGHVTCHICKTHRAKGLNAMKYHWKQCGKEREEFVCPECGKIYKSLAGLNYHVKTLHRTHSPSPPQEKEIRVDYFETLDSSKPLPSRRAAAQANQRLSEITQKERPSGKEEKGSVVLVSAMEEEVSKGGAYKVQLSELRSKMNSQGEVNCPYEGCERVFRSMAGVRYHLQRHQGGGSGGALLKYKCPFCQKVLSGRKRFENHCVSKHPDREVETLDFDDLEYKPESAPPSDHEISPENEDWEAEMDTIVPEATPPPAGGGARRAGGGVRNISNLPKTYAQYRGAVREYQERMYQVKDRLLGKKEWRPNMKHWKRLQRSEISSFLPTSRKSMSFRVVGKSSDEGVPNSLPLFQSTLISRGREAVFYAGGPVWALDWLHQGVGSNSQWIALTAHQDLDETHPILSPTSFKSAIQLWNLGELANTCSPSLTPSLPRFSLAIAHNYGCIHALKWYHATSSSVDQSEAGSNESCDMLRGGEDDQKELLGILSLACGDGCVRILSIPDPSLFVSPSLLSVPSSSPDDLSLEVTVVQPLSVSAVLVPVGVGVDDRLDFGQCLCTEWCPGNRNTKIAAGFSNGSVCIWDLNSEFFQSSSSSLSSVLTFHPTVHLTAHKDPCRCLSWCPHNENYLFTGGGDKMASMWDLRQPFSPIDKQEKGFMTYAVWPNLWCNLLMANDFSLHVGNLASFGLNYYNYTYQPFRSRSISLNKAPLCGVSYSMWTDRAAAASFGGELNIVTFLRTFHVSSIASYKKSYLIEKYHKLVLGCHLEPLDADSSLSQDVVDQSPLSSSKDHMDRSPLPQLSTSTDQSPLPQLSTSKDHSEQALKSEEVFAPPSAQSMKELADTSRLVMVLHSKTTLKESEGDRHIVKPEGLPLTALTQVCWSPNEKCSEWLVVGTNCGLMQLLSFPIPANK